MYRIIAGRTPTGYEQNMGAGINWQGTESLEAFILANGVFDNGVFRLPADPAPSGGLFDFRHRYPVQVVECHFDMGLGMGWSLDRIRGAIVDNIALGGPGATRLSQENDRLPILNPGDMLRLTSVGVIAGETSRALIYVKYS